MSFLLCCQILVTELTCHTTVFQDAGAALVDFDKKLGETDGYLELLLSQVSKLQEKQKLEKRKNQNGDEVRSKRSIRSCIACLIDLSFSGIRGNGEGR